MVPKDRRFSFDTREWLIDQGFIHANFAAYFMYSPAVWRFVGDESK